MGKLKGLLDGRKSYVGFIALGLLGLAKTQGWITGEQFEMWVVIVGSLTGVAMRAAIKKSNGTGGGSTPPSTPGG